jgi:hypothetical protein
MIDANQEKMLARYEAKIDDIRTNKAKTESAEEEMRPIQKRWRKVQKKWNFKWSFGWSSRSMGQ